MRLFEFGDWSRSPRWYRVYLHRYLVLFYKWFGYYRLWVKPLSDFIRDTKAEALMEYGSGSGEPLRLIVSCLERKAYAKTRFYLSDIRPNPEWCETINGNEDRRIRYVPEPVDALADNGRYSCPKVFVNSFHHFDVAQAKQIIRNSCKRKQDIIVLEYVRHTLPSFVSMLVGPLTIMLTMPFVARRRDWPIMMLFTYVVPLFPLMFFWDGLVSCRRSYSLRQMQNMVEDMGLSMPISETIGRNLLYPAGVSAIAITCSEASLGVRAGNPAYRSSLNPCACQPETANTQPLTE